MLATFVESAYLQLEMTAPFPWFVPEGVLSQATGLLGEESITATIGTNDE